MTEPSTSPIQTTTAAATTTTTTTIMPSPWGTLEELLLACAVHRYGVDAWDAISRELQKRTSSSDFTPVICQQKYRDLKRRFAAEDLIAGENSGDDAGLWLDELRRLRVAELRRDLQRYDLSIVSLQLKVKKLKEEREDKVEEETDLKKNEDKQTGINEVKVEPADENEPESEPVEPDIVEPDRVVEPGRGEGEDDSCNGSSNSKEERGGGEKERRERVDSAELVESVAEWKDDGGGERGEGVKESSDVQSTASLWRNENNNNNTSNNNKNKINSNNNNYYSNNKSTREKKLGVFSGTSSGEENQSPALKIANDGKSQPLIEFLDVVRGRKLVSYFERRLDSQKTSRYKSLIKQHIDLETIQRKLEEGQYTDCQTKFYRDLMLLINNAIVFFPKRSSEHKAALELRQLLDKQYQSHLSSPHDHKSHPSKSAQPPPLPKPVKPEASQADLKQPNLTITGPVIASRKRSSIAGKSSRGGGERKEPALVTALMTPSDEKTPLGEMVKLQREKASSSTLIAVTKKRTREQSYGSRSSSSKNNNSNPSPSTPISSKGENSEAKAKKPSPGNSSSKIKHTSGSGKNALLESLKNSDKRKSGNGNNSGNAKSDRRKDDGPQNGTGSKLGKDKAKGNEERVSPGNRSTRRPPKRAAAIAAMGKRGRDSGKEPESQAKKRQRR